MHIVSEILDLLGSNNVKEWGDALMENKTLIWLIMYPGKEEINYVLREKTKVCATKLAVQ